MTGTAQRYDCTVVRGDGERRVTSVSSAPLRDVGRIAGLVTALRDATEERRARDAVALSEARYRNLFETASDAIFTLDAQGAFTSANQATAALLGISRAELLGRSFTTLLTAAERDPATARMSDALAGISRRFDCTLVRHDGGRRMLSVTFTPLRHKRKLIGVLAIARDLTEERERAAALQRVESRYAYLVESASDAICTVDTEGRFTSVNRALELATGRTRDALIGQHFSVLLDPRDHAAARIVGRETMAGRRTRRELRYLDAAGVPRKASVMASPIMKDEVVAGGLAIVRDVAARRVARRGEDR
jgi:PAS domain S-box-containing protein